MKDYKFLDRVGVAYLWKRMTQYVNGIIPKKLSQLENDRGYTSNGVTSVNGSNGDVTINVPTKVSQLQNDSHFITENDIPTPTDVYTKSEVNSLLSGKQNTISDLSTIRDKATNAVPNTRKVNNKSLSSDITLNASDVGALPADTTLPTGIPVGGTTGQVLKKTSNSNYAVEWDDEEGGGSGDENVIETVKVNGTALTPDSNKAVDIDLSDYALISNVPAAVTESTVSGWGFTKNTGTYSMPSGGIPSTDFDSDVQTSLGKADTALQSETDPVFTASAAHDITSTDISNWNSKTSNVGTITGVTMNGASKGTSGVVNLGNVVTSVNNQTGAVTIATGDANVIEGITVNGTSVNPISKVVALTIPSITFKQW